MDILEYEIEQFKKEFKLSPDLSYKIEDNYYHGVSKAFDDAFNQYARRNKLSYKDSKTEYVKPICKSLFNYFTTDNITFESCYSECIENAKLIMENNKYGIAQKFVSMSFKYVMCFSDSKEIISKFDKCYMPLDKYTIQWIRTLNDKEINDELSNINNAWLNIDEQLFNKIQEKIRIVLSAGYNYKISFSPSAENNGYCTLPQNRLCAEFVIWHQERINEVHKILSKYKSDFERLGIREI